MEDRRIELEDFKTSFKLPDVITARMLLAYQGCVVQSRGSELFAIRRWEAVNRIGLIEDWQSELWPDLSKDILESDNLQVAELVLAANNAIFAKIQELQTTPKN